MKTVFVLAGWHVRAWSYDSLKPEDSAAITIKEKAFLKSASADGSCVNWGEDSKSNTFWRNQKGLAERDLGHWIKKLLSNSKHIWSTACQTQNEASQPKLINMLIFVAVALFFTCNIKQLYLKTMFWVKAETFWACKCAWRAFRLDSNCCKEDCLKSFTTSTTTSGDILLKQATEKNYTLGSERMCPIDQCWVSSELEDSNSTKQDTNWGTDCTLAVLSKRCY